MTNENLPQSPQTPLVATGKEIKARTNLFIQIWRFLGINVRMIGIIRKGHN